MNTTTYEIPALQQLPTWKLRFRLGTPKVCGITTSFCLSGFLGIKIRSRVLAMEGLAIASGVAGLLSLTIEVCRISAKYINGIRGATEAVQALLRELKALKKALMNLDELVESIDDETIFGTRSS